MASKVTELEKVRMWRLYQELRSYKKVAQRLRRSPDTVSRYVQEYDAAVRATGYVLNGMK